MLADKLKQILSERYISQADLSAKTGISRARISMYCSGASYPRPNAVKQIAEALNVPAGWLTGEVKEIEPSLSVPKVARALGVLPQALREGLKRCIYPFGYAVFKNGKYKYYISPTKFEAYQKHDLKGYEQRDEKRERDIHVQKRSY